MPATTPVYSTFFPCRRIRIMSPLGPLTLCKNAEYFYVHGLWLYALQIRCRRRPAFRYGSDPREWWAAQFARRGLCWIGIDLGREAQELLFSCIAPTGSPPTGPTSQIRLGPTATRCQEGSFWDRAKHPQLRILAYTITYGFFGVIHVYLSENQEFAAHSQKSAVTARRWNYSLIAGLRDHALFASGSIPGAAVIPDARDKRQAKAGSFLPRPVVRATTWGRTRCPKKRLRTLRLPPPTGHSEKA